MSVLKNKAPKTTGVKLVSINADTVIEQFKAWKGLGILEADADDSIKDWGVAMTTGNSPFPVMVITYPDRKVTCPFSRGSEIKTLEDATALLKGDDIFGYEFHLNNRFALDADGNKKPGQEDGPTGAPYICFGKPQGLGIADEVSIQETEPASKSKVGA